MKKMIADHMENGFLENIIDMFRHDQSLYAMLGDLLGDERSRVRIGVVALVETLRTDHRKQIRDAIPGIARLLKDDNPTIRGDAAYLLGIIGDPSALEYLSYAAYDDNEMVRESVRDAIADIENENKN